MPSRARLCIGRRVMSRDWNFTAPSSGLMTPTTMLKVVVLPAPLGPSRPTISPAATVMETPLTTRRWRYSFTSFSVASSLPLVRGSGGLVWLESFSRHALSDTIHRCCRGPKRLHGGRRAVVPTMSYFPGAINLWLVRSRVMMLLRPTILVASRTAGWPVSSIMSLVSVVVTR